MPKVKLKDSLDALYFLPMSSHTWYDAELLATENMWYWIRIPKLGMVIDVRHVDFKKE